MNTDEKKVSKILMGRDHVVTVTVTAEEKEQIIANALAKKMKLAEYGRYMMLKESNGGEK